MSELEPTHEHEPQPLERIEVDITDWAGPFQPYDEGIEKAEDLAALMNVELAKRGLQIVLFEHGVEASLGQHFRVPQDEELIDEALAEAKANQSEISDAAARVIAASMHGGQATALYSFTSTGAVDYEEIVRELSDFREGDLRESAEWLISYALNRHVSGNTGAVEGWSALWLGSDR